MRIYSNVTQAWKEIQRDLYEMGVQVPSFSVQDVIVKGDTHFDMLEMTGYGYKITGFEDLQDFIEFLGLNEDWIRVEFEERTGGKMLNPGNAWKFRRDVWEQFLHNGEFAYTYSQRINTYDSMRKAIEELKVHPTSRQAIIPVWFPFDSNFMGGASRIPCSMFYQPTIRDGKVDLHYIQRSCDFITHFPYDLVLAIKIQGWMAAMLRRLPGIFHHYITSLHAFRKDLPSGIF